jgi:hypothetical protein
MPLTLVAPAITGAVITGAVVWASPTITAVLDALTVSPVA